MENTLMKSDGVEILVESAVINKKFSDLYYMSQYSLDDYDLDNLTEAGILEFRNDSRISAITDTDNFVNKHITALSRSVLKKQVSLEEALGEVYKINLICDTDYKIDDVYKNVNYLKEDSGIQVKYNGIDLSIVNKYRNLLEKKSECLNSCLYEGLFDKKLVENLSILGIAMNNIL